MGALHVGLQGGGGALLAAGAEGATDGGRGTAAEGAAAVDEYCPDAMTATFKADSSRAATISSRAFPFYSSTGSLATGPAPLSRDGAAACPEALRGGGGGGGGGGDAVFRLTVVPGDSSHRGARGGGGGSRAGSAASPCKGSGGSAGHGEASGSEACGGGRDPGAGVDVGAAKRPGTGAGPAPGGRRDGVPSSGRSFGGDFGVEFLKDREALTADVAWARSLKFMSGSELKREVDAGLEVLRKRTEDLCSKPANSSGLFTACAAIAAGIEKAVVSPEWETMVERVKEAGARGVLSVAGSPRFRVYDVDFGFGKPGKVEIVSVARTGAMAVAEIRGGGGMEVGVSLPPASMEAFRRCFDDAIASLSLSHSC